MRPRVSLGSHVLAGPTVVLPLALLHPFGGHEVAAGALERFLERR